MSTETLKQDLKTQKSPVPVHPFITMLQASEGEIKKALPSHLKPERMIRIALTAFRRNPKLAECDPRSVLAAVIQSAQLGLEPDTLGRSYFVPYKTECQFIPGWKGLVDLVNRAGNASVWTGAVYEGDEFDYALGDKPFIQHRPTGDDDPDKLRYAYAVGRVKGSEWPVIEVWTMKRVWNHRDRYNKVGKSHYSYSNQEMYARKVTLLQVLKYMPMSPELTLAMELDHSAESGRQGLTMEDAKAGTWSPPIIDVVEDEKSPVISKDQFDELFHLMQKVKEEDRPGMVKSFLATFVVKSINDLPSGRFEEAKKWIEEGVGK